MGQRGKVSSERGASLINFFLLRQRDYEKTIEVEVRGRETKASGVESEKGNIKRVDGFPLLFFSCIEG